MKDCKHLNFYAHVNVGRIIDDVNMEKVKHYMADIKIKCNDCGLPFEFIGFEHGMSFVKPLVSIDYTEARIPIRPSTDPVEQIKAMQ